MYKTKYLNKKLQFIGTIFYSKWRLQVAGTNKNLNLITQLDNISLFYENIHISSQNPHFLCMFNSFWKDIASKTLC